MLLQWLRNNKVIVFLALLGAMYAIHKAYARFDEDITLTAKNTVVLRGEVTDESVGQAINAILSSSEDQLYLYISSPGGSVLAGNSFITAMRSSGKKVTCIADVAASMAFAILQACDRRLVMENSIIMQHVASYGIQGAAPNNRAFVSFIEEVLEKLQKEQAQRIGISVDEFKQKIRDDWWIFDRKAISTKTADGYVRVHCDSAMIKSRVKQEIPTLFGTIKLEWSGCPVISYPISIGMSEPFSDNPKESKALLDSIMGPMKARECVMRRFDSKDKSRDPNSLCE